MKTKDIFENMDEEFDDEIDFSEVEFEEFDDVFVASYNPTHVTIDENSPVALVQDAQVIARMPWGQLIDWINDNWQTLSGSFDVVKDGAVLHSFVVSQNS